MIAHGKSVEPAARAPTPKVHNITSIMSYQTPEAAILPPPYPTATHDFLPTPLTRQNFLPRFRKLHNEFSLRSFPPCPTRRHAYVHQLCREEYSNITSTHLSCEKRGGLATSSPFLPKKPVQLIMRESVKAFWIARLAAKVTPSCSLRRWPSPSKAL